MSRPKYDGGPAFPCAGHESGVEFDRGMSLRDYFAAKALGQVIHCMQSGSILIHETAGGGPGGIAATAYDIADAMLAARKEGA